MYAISYIKDLEDMIEQINEMIEYTKNPEERSKLLLFKLDINNSIKQLKQYLNDGEDANEKQQKEGNSICEKVIEILY